MRNLTLACALLLLTGCVSVDVARCSSGATALKWFGSTRARAIEVLRTAEQLESSTTGPAAAPSCSTAAYQNLLKRRDAADAFRSVFDRATAAGKVYALAGLYEVDRGAFDALVGDAKASSPATFDRVDGCIVMNVSRDQVFAQLSSGALSAWWRPHRQ